MPTALVTGASSGIGLAFATELAARGYDLVLVARDPERLARAGERLRSRGVQVSELSADLGRRDDLSRVEAVFDEQAIDLLVNDAGFAAHDDLLDADWQRQVQALDVMCLAVLVLSGAAARAMAERGHGEIVNISSMNALIPVDNYSAVKAWVVTYTEALASRLNGTGVHANVTIAGWVKTDFHAAAGLERPHIPGWVWVPVASLVTQALGDVSRGRIRTVPTLHWRIAAWALQHGPLALSRAVSRKVRSGHDKNRIPTSPQHTQHAQEEGAA